MPWEDVRFIGSKPISTSSGCCGTLVFLMIVEISGLLKIRRAYICDLIQYQLINPQLQNQPLEL